jgi:ketopantoate reductase
MPGSKPGERRGGRKKGTPNKTTQERQINAAREIDRARKEGRELAKDVLERLMHIAEGATGVNRPTTQADLEKGIEQNPESIRARRSRR